MATLRNKVDDKLDPQYDNEQLADVSADEPTADAPQDEDEEHQRIRRVKNAKCAQCGRNTQNRAREPRDLNNTFAGVADREYRTPIGAIAEAALLAQQLPPNPQIQTLQYLTQRALVQPDGQHPVSSTQILPRGLSTMVKQRRLVTPLEEALGVGGTTTASATRATRLCVATMNKKYNNPLATSVVQGIKAKIRSRLAFMTLP
jgi:hypothetical protein